MAKRNIDVIIQRPAFSQVNKIDLTEYLGGDVVNIPRRTPYTNIKNLAQLKTDGFFRTKTTEVTEEYGGNNAKDGFTNLGLTLPRTEKLVMLVNNPGETAVDIVVGGNTRTGQPEQELKVAKGLHTFDLYDLGLLIQDTQEKSATITIKGATTVKLEMVLLARY